MILYRKFQNSGVIAESTGVVNPAVDARKRRMLQSIEAEKDFNIPLQTQEEYNNRPVYTDQGEISTYKEPSMWEKYSGSKFANNPYVQLSPAGIITDAIDAGSDAYKAIESFANDDYIQSAINASMAMLSAVPVVGDSREAKRLIRKKLARDINNTLRKGSKYPLRVQIHPGDEEMLTILHDNKPLGYFALDELPNTNMVERVEAFPFEHNETYIGTGAIKDLMGSMVQSLLKQDKQLVSSIDHTGKGRKAYERAEAAGAVRKAPDYTERKPRWVYNDEFGKEITSRVVPREMVNHNTNILNRLKSMNDRYNIVNIKDRVQFENDATKEAFKLLSKNIDKLDESLGRDAMIDNDFVKYALRDMVSKFNLNDRKELAELFPKMSKYKEFDFKNMFRHMLNSNKINRYDKVRSQLKGNGGILYKK